MRSRRTPEIASGRINSLLRELSKQRCQDMLLPPGDRRLEPRGKGHNAARSWPSTAASPDGVLDQVRVLATVALGVQQHRAPLQRDGRNMCSEPCACAAPRSLLFDIMRSSRLSAWRGRKRMPSCAASLSRALARPTSPSQGCGAGSDCSSLWQSGGSSLAAQRRSVTCKARRATRSCISPGPGSRSVCRRCLRTSRRPSPALRRHVDWSTIPDWRCAKGILAPPHGSGGAQ